jgi:acyl carrier protein
MRKTGVDNKAALFILESILKEPDANIIVSTKEIVSNSIDEIEFRSDFHKLNNIKSSLKDQLKKIWMQALEVEKIDDDDDFFELGGDSLSAIHLNYQIKKILKKDILTDVILNKSKFITFYQHLLNV